MDISNASRLALIVSCSAFALAAAANAAQAGDLINGNSLLVTTTTYEKVGQVAGLVGGLHGDPRRHGGFEREPQHSLEQLHGRRTVRRHLAAHASRTSARRTAKLLASETLPTNQIVTSFSSKSELGLSIARTASGPVATFMGYAPGGAGYPPTAAGMLDVSNADSTSYVDPTNVASQFYKSTYADYAFNRSVVAVSANGSFSITPTLAYGGDNSRAAVLAPNGLYYTVGNSNSGTTTRAATDERPPASRS